MEKDEPKEKSFGFEDVPARDRVTPPPVEEKEEEVFGRPEEAAPGKPGWMPLSPTAIIAPIEVYHGWAAEKTGWNGWFYSDPQRADLEKAINEMKIYAPVWASFLACLVGVEGMKMFEYRMWKRSESKGATGSIIGAEEPPMGR